MTKAKAKEKDKAFTKKKETKWYCWKCRKEAIKKFPTPYEGDKGRWSSRYESWRVDTAEKLQKILDNRPLRKNYPSPQTYVLAFKEWLSKFEELLEALR